MDFKNANELLTLCEEKNLPISESCVFAKLNLAKQPLKL